jgi:DNA replication protein DnaC
MSVVEPALLSCLRTLKLSGMLETLDARLAQARAGELGHLEFLQVLCHDEITRRETVAMSRRLRRAHFEQQLTLKGFDLTWLKITRVAESGPVFRALQRFGWPEFAH